MTSVMRRIALFLLALSAISGGIYFATSGSNSASPAVSLLMAQQYPDADGQVHRLDRYQGQLLVVNFWASWCAPCVQEMPELSELADELAGQNVQFLGLAIDSQKNVSAFTRDRVQVSYPLLVLGAGGIEMGSQFGNSQGALPFTVVIDREGQIVERILGRVKMADLRRLLTAQP